MDATGVNYTSVAGKNDKQRYMKFGFCPVSPSPNIGMHSASNKFKRSGNLAEWREFINFRAEKMKSENIGSENERTWHHFKASSRGASNGGNGYPSHDLNVANFPGDVAGRFYFIASRAEQKNKFHNSVIPSNEAWSPCKNVYCTNLCGPLGSYPAFLQSKVENGLLFRPSHCADCIAARKLTRPLSQMVPLTPLAVFGKSRAPVSLAFPEEARASAAHAGNLLDATACRIASLEAKFARLCDATEAAALGLHSKMLQRHALNDREGASAVLHCCTALQCRLNSLHCQHCCTAVPA